MKIKSAVSSPPIKRAVILACTGGISYEWFREVSSVDQFVQNLETTIKSKLASLDKEVKTYFSTNSVPETAGTFLAGFTHPSPKLNKHLDVLNELFDKADTLESIYTMLVSFQGSPKYEPLVQRVQSMITFTRKRVDRALLALSSGVEKHQPEYFARCVRSVVLAMKQFSPQYQTMDVISLMRVIVNSATGDLKGTQFSVYLCFKGLMDAKGYQHPSYHIVLTCVVDLYGKFTMSVALQPTMLLPGKFRSSDQFTSPSDCMAGIIGRMDEEGFAWSTQ